MLDETIAQARRILSATQRFGRPLDTGSLLSVANEADPRWEADPEKYRINMRALDLLIEGKLLIPDQNGYAYSLSARGKEATFLEDSVVFSGAWFEAWVASESMVEALRSQRSSSETIITKLVVENWRQFAGVDLLFHPRLTILTGANGAGKTTLLNLLSPHFEWSAQLLTRQLSNEEAVNVAHAIGKISYSSGETSSLVQSVNAGISNMPVAITQMQHVPGIFVSSHRSISSYQQLQALPARFSEWESLRQQFTAEVQARYFGGSTGASPLYRMKEALVAAAMHAYGNKAVRPNDSARELWEGYQDVLRNFLPPSLQFERFEVEDSEIVMVTKVAEFPLEAVSGGISAMLELSWQIYLRRGSQSAFTVCIDEPENHLHPELQRSIIPSLLKGFPDVTFIVATHSPFVVTSTTDAFVYALGTNERGQVVSRRVTNIDSASTPDETLMSVLGLDSTLPLWAEDKLSALLEALPAAPTTEELRDLRDQMVALGLDRQFPDAIQSIGPSE